MRILVTGGAGFIGSAVCRHLVLEQRWTVLNLDKLTYAANLKSLAAVETDPNYRFVRTDICDRAALKALFSEFKPDGVMHLAAESHVDRSISGPAEFISTNINRHALPAGSGPRLLERAQGRRQGALPLPPYFDRRGLWLARRRPTCSTSRRPTIRARPTPPARPRAIIWCMPGITPTGCRSWSRTARTTTAPIISRKSSSRW